MVGGDRCLSLEMIVVMVDGWWRSMPVADDDRSDG
jgi:hypothetical protein